MNQPTIQKRLQKRLILMSRNADLVQAVKNMLPDDWEMIVTTDLEVLGDWNEILLYRFLILDLDENEAFDPLDVIGQIRLQFQINLPVFCVGGDADLQNEMRLGRADRFFDRSGLIDILPEFFKQYAW